MTERKIQDYLPYYIGQEIERHFQGELIVSELTAENLAGFISGWDSRWHKLRLRPLSDMAYEEFVEAGKIHISEGGTIAVTFEEVRSNTVLPMRPKTFVYLLSKGFDLFGLIESNLAINKSTLKP